MNNYDLMQKDRFDDGENIFNFVIHLRLKKRNTKKTNTIVDGIPDEFDLDKILRYWKKSFNCTGTIVEEWDKEKDVKYTFIQLTGDHRAEIAKFLVDEGIALKDNLKIHGI